MISFKFISNQILPKIFPKKYPEVLEYEGDFSIEINNMLYFQESNFSVFEFLMYIDSWKTNNHDDMQYICLDTDENPLISFIKNGDGFVIKSPWELFNYKEVISQSEIDKAVSNLKNDLGLGR